MIMSQSKINGKRILILTSRYLPKPAANGLIVDHIVKEMKDRGFDVLCLSVKRPGEIKYEVIDGVKIFRVSPSLYSRIQESDNKKFIFKFIKKLSRVFRSIKLGLLVFKFPDFDFHQNKKVYKTIDNILKDEEIDSVIGVYKPYSNIAALKTIRKKYPQIKCGALYLDLVNSMRKPRCMPNGTYNYLVNKNSFDILKSLDFLLIPPQGEKLFIKKKFNQLEDKIHNIEFPTLIDTGETSHINESILGCNYIKVTYAGTLDENYRNPDKLLYLLDKATNKIGNIELNIYGFNNCESLFEKYRSEKLTIINNGTVPHSIVIKSMLASNYVVNIGNANMDAVPSKIFELFSTGKPIINLISDKNDGTKIYFDSYPSSFEIKAYDNINNYIEDFVDFLVHEKDKQADNKEIKRIFYKNTPAYTVDKIEQILEN